MCNISYGIAEKNYKKGLSEGLSEMNKEKFTTIQRMLQRNMPIDDIKFYTNATEEEIKKAKEEICVK